MACSERQATIESYGNVFAVLSASLDSDGSDTTGNGNDGVVVGNVEFAEVDGRDAARFTGRDTYIEIDSDAINGGAWTAFTVSASAQVGEYTTYGTAVSRAFYEDDEDVPSSFDIRVGGMFDGNPIPISFSSSF